MATLSRTLDQEVSPEYGVEVEFENRCDICGHEYEATLALGAMWVCPGCFENAKNEWGKK